MASVAKVKPGNQDGPSKGQFDASANKKKIESSEKQYSVSSKNKSVVAVAKTEVKSKASSSSSKTNTITTAKTTKVREKKVFSLPGQKYDRPEEREPLRIFYESLSKQIPTSEMAEFWMMEHGLLSPEKAKKAHEKKQRKQKQLRTGTPIKSLPQSRSETKPQPSKSGDVKTKKRIINESDDDDFILSPKRRKG